MKYTDEEHRKATLGGLNDIERVAAGLPKRADDPDYIPGAHEKDLHKAYLAKVGGGPGDPDDDEGSDENPTS